MTNTQPYCSRTRVHAQPQRLVRAVGLIGDVAVGAVGPPAPAVERTLDAVADHLAAVSDVRAEVTAVTRQHVQFARLVAIGDQVLTEVPKRAHLAGRRTRPTSPTMNQPVTFQVKGTFTRASCDAKT